MERLNTMKITDKDILKLLCHNIMQIEIWEIKSQDKKLTTQQRDELNIRIVATILAISPLFDQLKTISDKVKETIEYYEETLDECVPNWKNLKKHLENFPIESIL